MAVVPPLLGTIAEAAAPLTPSFSVEFVANFDDQSSGHTVYEIEVTAPDGACWMIHKRYSEVRELHDTLRLWLGDRLPPIPGRRLFGNRDPAFIIERQTGLQRCLNGTFQLIASQKPSLLGFVGQFLGCAEQTGRGRTPAAANRRETCGERRLYQDSSAPPATPSSARLFQSDACHSTSNPRATSLESASTVGSQWHARAGALGTPSTHQLSTLRPLSRSFTPMRSESATSRSIPPNSSEAPAEHRARRWSRRHQRPETESSAVAGSFVCTSPRETMDAMEETADGGAVGRRVVDEMLPAVEPQRTMTEASGYNAIISAVSDDAESAPAPGSRSDKVVACQSESAVQGEDAEEQCPDVLSFCDTDTPAQLASPAPHGDSWDWPLSRPEKIERVRLIERQMNSMDQNLLKGEIEQLRSAQDCARSDTSSKLSGSTRVSGASASSSA